MAANEIAGRVIGGCIANRHSKYSYDYVLAVPEWLIMREIV